MCALVIGLGNVSIPLLSRGVPDLELEAVVVNCDGFDLEVDPDGCYVVLFELVVAKSY